MRRLATLCGSNGSATHSAIAFAVEVSLMCDWVSYARVASSSWIC